MNSKEIEHNIQTIIDNFSEENFIYDLLLAYGISKTSITRLKKVILIYLRMKMKFFIRRKYFSKLMMEINF